MRLPSRPLHLLPSLALILGCDRTPPRTAPAATAPPRIAAEPAVALPWAATQTEPPARESLGHVVASIRRLATPSGMRALPEWLTPAALAQLRQPNGALAILPGTLQRPLAGPFDALVLDGGRVALLSHDRGVARTAWFYLINDRWRLDAANGAAWHPADPGPADPLNHPISLAEAATGIDGAGGLFAVFATSAGRIDCLLFAEEVPGLIAHFVGLARGKRAWRDGAGGWQRRPFYDHLPIHRALPGIWAVTGDPTGKGPGGAGFHIADVLRLGLRHDKPGVLSLVTLGQPNTASSQIAFFAAPAPWADDHHLPIGLCAQVDVIARLSDQPPHTAAVESVTFRRGPLAGAGP